MTVLWTFDSKIKLEQFGEILKSNDIGFEVGDLDGRKADVVISVDDADYTKAKKLLMKHRKRRTSGDFR